MKNPSFTTSINGQPHFLAYINPKEAGFLRSLGGGITKDGGQMMHQGVPAFGENPGDDSDHGGSTTDQGGPGSFGGDDSGGTNSGQGTQGDPDFYGYDKNQPNHISGPVDTPEDRAERAARERAASPLGGFVGALNEAFGFDKDHGYGGTPGHVDQGGHYNPGTPAIGFGDVPAEAVGLDMNNLTPAQQSVVNMYGLNKMTGLTQQAIDHITGARHSQNPTTGQTLTNQNTWGAFAEAQPFWGGVADAIASPIGQALSFGLGIAAPGFGTPFGLAANRDLIAASIPPEVMQFAGRNPDPQGLGTGTNDQQDQGNEGVWSEGQQPGMQRTTAVGSSGDDTLSNAQKAAYVKAITNPGVPWSDALKEKLDFSGTSFIGHSGSYRPYAGDYLTYGRGGGHNFYGGYT